MRNCLHRKALFLVVLFNLISLSFSRKVFSGNVFHDRTVLLELKRSFIDHNGILSSWDSDSSDHCSWYGVSCDSKSRVVSLILKGCHTDQDSFDSADLSSCSYGLGGKISPAVGKLTEIRVLSLAFNDLRGELPEEIWGLKKLEVLDLKGTNFIGNFPRNFSGLKRIRVLNLGLYQNSWEIQSVMKIDLSEIVRCQKRKCTRFLHNVVPGDVLEPSRNKIRLRKLMGDDEEEDEISPKTDTKMSQSSSGKDGLYPIEIASIVSASVIVFVLLILVFLFLYIRKWKRNSQIQVAEPREIRVFVDIGVPLTYETVVRATGYFSNVNCIGHGGFGSTYKSEVSPTAVLAVKRLSVGRFQGVQQFHAEIMTLEMVRHPNLVTLIGYHASETEMFLIYNYLSGGNLEDFIKERSESAIDWKILHKISMDVARALAYLHDQCSPKVLHRDIKPSNILLDNNYNAYLSDFGLSRLLGASQSHVTTGVAGTFGYVAPEYALTCRVSEKADVYSYGIVLLELISDKRALDPSFSSQENIVSWAHKMLRQGKAKDVFVKGLWESGPQDDLVEVLHLALKCTVDSLSTRPTMKQVVQQLKQNQPSKAV